MFLELGGSWDPKNVEVARGRSSKNSEMASEQKRGCPLTDPRDRCHHSSKESCIHLHVQYPVGHV